MGRLILCVEDEADLRADLAEELEAAGYVVAQAEDGREALALLADRAPDLVLCDITMPGMDGFELLRRLRAERPDLADIPFVFLTALADRADMLAGREAGADDYLVKPIDFDLMLATVASRLRQVDRMREKADRQIEEVRAAFAGLATQGGAAPPPGSEAAARALNHVALGVLLLDAEGEVTFANRTATAILEQKDGLTLSNRRLRGANAEQNKALRELVDAVHRRQGSPENAALSLPRPSGARPLAILACALGTAPEAGVALFVSDAERRPRMPPEVAARLYGLTPAEVRLALALAEGQRLDEIAAESGLSRNTLASTLRSIFRKTETDRQADLVSLFLANPVSLSDG
ncbi:response regulator [Roseomonas sp. OT10]|uniref:response regulator n=1 Tax=Roseomonas cutis TaxID=2897332 RepID=UPI001E414E96|nr:response regulator [Roseomonas sp. OT10]UFN50113.1 response regulator [Roseomonas sp. OT10]